MVYLVEFFWPGVTLEATLEAAARLRCAADATRDPNRVRHLGMGFLPGDEYVFWLLEAPSPAAVAAANRHAGLSFDRVVPAWFFPHPQAT